MPAENRGGWRSLLSSPAIYELVQTLAGGRAAERRLIHQHVSPHSRVLDVGCGPGAAVAFMPPGVAYLGIDHSESYIRSAQRRFPGARFICGDLRQLCASTAGPFDVVLANGVLHHIDDDAVRSLLATVRSLLAADGKFVSVDPCLTDTIHPLTRAIVLRDRGRHVRHRNRYVELIGGVFPNIDSRVDAGFIPVPHCALTAVCRP